MKQKTTIDIIKDIPLIDWGLLIIMALLLIQSAIQLFVLKTASTGNLTSLDVVFRTTFAGIFGYFLSENFVRHSVNNQDDITTPISRAINLENPVEIEELMPISMIGFKDSEAPLENVTQTAAISPSQTSADTNNQKRRLIQVVISIVMAFYCLIILMILRNFWTIDNSVMPTVSQLRDVVSGCVGFLMGMPSGATKS